MQKNERIVRYTADEFEEVRRRGDDRTDDARLAALTPEKIEASIDYEDEGEFDLSQARPCIPGYSELLTICVEQDVLAWFKAQDGSHHARIDAVLRDDVAAPKRAAASSRS